MKNIVYTVVILLLFVSYFFIKNEESKHMEQEEEKIFVEENNIQYLKQRELDKVILNQPLYVLETKYVDLDELRYADYALLQSILYNNSDTVIKNAIIGFCAWDKKGSPIKIGKDTNQLDEGYFAKALYETLNLNPNETFMGKIDHTYIGLPINADLNVDKIKAIVVSYKDSYDNVWTNPNLDDFVQLYVGKKLIE